MFSIAMVVRNKRRPEAGRSQKDGQTHTQTVVEFGRTSVYTQPLLHRVDGRLTRSGTLSILLIC